MKMTKIMLLSLSLLLGVGLVSCEKEDDTGKGNTQNPNNNAGGGGNDNQNKNNQNNNNQNNNENPNPVTPVNDDFAMGYEFEDATDLEKDLLPISFGANYTGTMPDAVDLSDYFPSIGDQDRWGTCVAWSTAYNYRTYLRASAGKLSKKHLSEPKYQFSPKDLFLALDKSAKKNGCNGTCFSAAFDLLKERGVATLETVPYENLGDCYGTVPSAWTREANEYKISDYKNIDSKTLSKNGIKELKGYLCMGKPISFGADVYTSFSNYEGGVIYSQSGDYRGGHAMIICGYDDNKGSNGAFKIVNSWNDDWGEEGYGWVDYNYMLSGDFAYLSNFFVAYSNDREIVIDDDDNTVDDDDLVDGYDLAVERVEFVDYYAPGDPDSDDPTWRTLKFNVYNAGTATIPSSKRWNVLAVLYNVHNPSDVHYLQVDRYTDEFGDEGDTCSNWTIDSGYGDPEIITGYHAEGGYAWNNVNLKSGQGAAEAVSGRKDTRFKWPVRIPPELTGDYELVLWADSGCVIEETTKDNNRFSIKADDGGPLHIVNGVVKNMSSKKATIKSETKALDSNLAKRFCID